MARDPKQDPDDFAAFDDEAYSTDPLADEAPVEDVTPVDDVSVVEGETPESTAETPADEPASDDEAADNELETVAAGKQKKKRDTSKLFKPWLWDADLYTVLLALSLICISISCLVLWLELQQFGGWPWWSTTDATPRMGG